MPRQARSSALVSNVLHIITRGNNRQSIFLHVDDFKYYLELLRATRQKYDFKIFHYALMPNHVHLMIRIDDLSILPKIMQEINQRYAIYHKKRTHRIGHLFQGRYKAVNIKTDAHFLACGAYIDLNPVRAGLVDDPRNYPWSSYNYLAYGKQDNLTTESEVYLATGLNASQRRSNYRKYVETWRNITPVKDIEKNYE